MNTKLYTELFEGLKQCLKSLDKSINVYQFPPQKQNFPVVLFNEIANQNYANTLDKIEQIDEIGYEIEIFCSPKNVNETISQSSMIAEKSDAYMRKHGFQRVSVNRVPNLDDRVYRVILRYSASLFINSGRIF